MTNIPNIHVTHGRPRGTIVVSQATEGALMPAASRTTSRTERLLALMAKGDDLFNTRDWEKLDDVHRPNMIAHIPGSAEPIYGRAAHGAAMQQLVRIFPDIRVNTPYPIQFGDGDWITVVTNASRPDRPSPSSSLTPVNGSPTSSSPSPLPGTTLSMQSNSDAPGNARR